MFKNIFKILIIFFSLIISSESKNFNNIIINGNERISDETILVFSEIDNVEFLDENSINLILKKLYQSGFFNDVTINLVNKDLIIEVSERPIIQSVVLEGVKKKKSEEEIYKILSLKDRSSFNTNSVKKDEIKILNYLKGEGYYFSTVVSSIQELKNNKLDLYYKIDLGSKSKISKISFIGDKKFKDNTLRRIIVSEEYKFWKIISGKKFLNENLINFDKRLLDNFYKNKGFYNAIIESSFANYLGNDEFELIYNISSGKKYYFNDLILKLPLDYDDENFDKLKSMFSNLKGKNYSLTSIDEILKEIDKIVLNKQYEFLKSTVNEEINDNLINLTFNIEESEKFYVEKINIFGNNITQEEVIRNSFSVDEGDAFNELLHTRTINNLKSLNFFKNIKSDVINGTLESQKIINLTFEEKATGEISAGAGIGTNGGTVAFSVSENNFLGRGIEFGTNLSVSGEEVKGMISLNNPNYQGSNRSLNFSAESTVVDRINNYGYETTKTGFRLGSGFEYYDNLYLNTGISTYVERLKTDNTASASLKKQKGTFFDTFFNYTFTYDVRNQRYQPTEGFVSRFTQNVPLLSKNYSLTNTYDFKIYNEWLNENIASYGFYMSGTRSIAGKDIKLSERLFIPSKKLRGFEAGRIGPKDGKDYIGGNYIMAFNAATTMPQIFPNFESANFSLFFDAANVWGIDYNDTIGDGSKIRSSIGLAVDLFTPIGPLNFSISEPITKGKNDITEFFRFNLGATF
jgi:outer membrane protein insertion porin family